MTDERRPPTASAPPRTEAPETRRSAYAFPICACERCWHGESYLTIHNKVMTACPKCGGTMREVGIPVTEAPQPCDLLCLVCARVKPWGIWDQTSGIAVCVECRDKARTPSPSADTGGAAETALMTRLVAYESIIASLRARLAESERDTQRLDWLEREGHSLFTYGAQRWDVPDYGVATSPRAAIDAAIAYETDAVREPT